MIFLHYFSPIRVISGEIWRFWRNLRIMAAFNIYPKRRKLMKLLDAILIPAATENASVTVGMLLSFGADVNAKMEGGYAALHFAALNNAKKAAEMLLDKGADVNAKADNGKTALDLAEEKNAKETAELLRKHGGKLGKEL
ncbi:MAG: hypothetical protein HAW59_05345 [Betaproteobacteria bacterium]|nr:hypothetical protein [Betaproteobacteria bacterium]